MAAVKSESLTPTANEEKNMYEVPLDEQLGAADRASEGTRHERTGKQMDGLEDDAIVAPEGKQVGLLVRLKKPRPLPSPGRLKWMM